MKSVQDDLLRDIGRHEIKEKGKLFYDGPRVELHQINTDGHEWKGWVDIVFDYPFGTQRLVALHDTTSFGFDVESYTFANAQYRYEVERYNWICCEIDESKKGYTYFHYALIAVCNRVTALDCLLNA